MNCFHVSVTIAINVLVFVAVTCWVMTASHPIGGLLPSAVIVVCVSPALIWWLCVGAQGTTHPLQRSPVRHSRPHFFEGTA